MAQHRQRYLFDVIGSNKQSPADRRQRLRAQQQRYSRPRAGSPRNRWARPSAPDNRYYIPLDSVFDRDLADVGPALEHRREVLQWGEPEVIQTARIESAVPVGDHLEFFLFGRVAD